MIGISIANSLGLNKLSAGINPDAAAFIAAAGITGTTQVDAVNALVNGLQTDGLWSNMKAVYPFVTDNRNLLGYTEFLGNLSVWTRTNTTVTNNSTTAPNGTLTADSITSNSSVVASLNQLNLANAAGTYTQSFYIKQGSGGASAVLYLNDGTTSNYSAAWFNLVTGTLLTVTSVGTFSGASSAITNEGNGWYRCSLTFTKPSTANSSFSISISPDNSFASNSGSQIFAWGAQLELGALTAYQPIIFTTQVYIASQFKYNLKDPRDLDAAFRLVFNGGMIHSSNGILFNGTNGWANTSAVNTINSFGCYTRNASDNNKDYMGTQDSFYTDDPDGPFWTLYKGYQITYDTYIISNLYNPAATNNTIRTGLSSVNADGLNQKFYKNGVLKNTSSVNTPTPPTITMAVGALNPNSNTQGGTIGTEGYSNQQIAFAFMGSSTFNQTQNTNLYNRIQTFQTSLSRQV